MKIALFEVRDDEEQKITELSYQYDIETLIYHDILTVDKLDELKGVDGISTLGQSTINKAILDKMKENHILYLSTRTIGYNHIDIDYAKEIGIKVCNAAYEPNGVAEYTIMLMLMVLRRYKPALWRSQVYDYSLTGLQGRELRNLTVGIIGTGRIGAMVIKILSGFGCQILAYDLHPNDELKTLATYVSLDTIYKECDMISLHLPLFKSTYHLIDKEAISQMKDGVILINCARGQLMDLDVLIDGIENRKIGGLGLDSVEGEEDIIHQDLRNDIINSRGIAYLRQFPNVVHTSHMAFYTKEAVDSMVYYGIKGLYAMKQGEPWPTIINAR